MSADTSQILIVVTDTVANNDRRLV